MRPLARSVISSTNSVSSLPQYQFDTADPVEQAFQEMLRVTSIHQRAEGGFGAR